MCVIKLKKLSTDYKQVINIKRVPLKRFYCYNSNYIKTITSHISFVL